MSAESGFPPLGDRMVYGKSIALGMWHLGICSQSGVGGYKTGGGAACCKPNEGSAWRDWKKGFDVRIITQNIDNLHEQAERSAMSARQIDESPLRNHPTADLRIIRKQLRYSF